jgi:hypothetical protein
MKKFKTLPAAMIPVRVNAKTTIMVKPGDDPQEAIDRFNNSISRGRTYYSDRQRLNTAERRRKRKEGVS